MSDSLLVYTTDLSSNSTGAMLSHKLPEGTETLIAHCSRLGLLLKELFTREKASGTSTTIFMDMSLEFLLFTKPFGESSLKSIPYL